MLEIVISSLITKGMMLYHDDDALDDDAGIWTSTKKLEIIRRKFNQTTGPDLPYALLL